MTDSHTGEDLEIRIVRELTEIKLEIQSLKHQISNTDLQLSCKIADHQANCPMMAKQVLTRDQYYPEWLECHKRYSTEQAKGFDVWYERGKKIITIAGAIYIIAININWQGITEVLR